MLFIAFITFFGTQLDKKKTHYFSIWSDRSKDWFQQLLSLIWLNSPESYFLYNKYTRSHSKQTIFLYCMYFIITNSISTKDRFKRCIFVCMWYVMMLVRHRSHDRSHVHTSSLSSSEICWLGTGFYEMLKLFYYESSNFTGLSIWTKKKKTL